MKKGRKRRKLKHKTGIVLKWVHRQTGRTHRKRDKKRKALHPGKRESRWGGIYYEYRRNRTDENYHTRL